MKKTIRILMALVCMVTMLCTGFAVAEAPIPEEIALDAAEVPVTEENALTEATEEPFQTPSPEELGELTFRILDSEGNEVQTIQYSEFADGKYSVEGLLPGTYTVTEVDPDQLLEDYTFDAENSIQTITLEVLPKETASDTLINVYERVVEVTETPSPEPTETPEPTPEPTATPEPTPVPIEQISIPVIKIWEDQGNRDGNRPDRVIVNLLANGNKVAQAVLSAAGGWSYEFTELPKYAGEQEIVYSVTEEPVAMYTTRIDGFTITNTYTPVTTSATVSKVWWDDDNAAGIRPLSIYCTLSNGMHVLLSDANEWTATIDGLPTVVNGQEVTYSWTEQISIGYEQVAVNVVGNSAVFTNAIIERPTEVPEGKTPPNRTRGESYLVIEDYGTPLGVDVIINHVGDCFD